MLSIFPIGHIATIALFDGYAGVRAAVGDIITVLIQIVALLLAISIATGFLQAQIGYVVGAPAMLSDVWLKIGAVVLCVILALAAVPISNTIVDALGALF